MSRDSGGPKILQYLIYESLPKTLRPCDEQKFELYLLTGSVNALIVTEERKNEITIEPKFGFLGSFFDYIFGDDDDDDEDDNDESYKPIEINCHPPYCHFIPPSKPSTKDADSPTSEKPMQTSESATSETPAGNGEGGEAAEM
ncbi:uncharacterized protein LOC129613718 [Condylostylus longicornis]|uniref:uncharacterized protein LOC129613718 n=1 Tax=Condylostylus longicornis TaxID=2530218 RepID=UPI00244DF38A|nr:uncharacterized protein LOC129613718 [Condylostylus longicornis]